MNYLEQINAFWAKSESDNISVVDISVYMALLKYCNGLNWLNPFICHWDIICQYSKCSKNAFYKSINSLHEKGYIKYEKGERNRLQPKVSVLQLKNRKGTVREQLREQPKEQKGNLYKLLNNKTIKLIEKNYKEINQNLENWIHKKEDKYYRVIKHLKLEFEEFEKLRGFGFLKSEIDSVLDSIENYKKNTNYTSLYLTAKKWLEKEKSSAKKEKQLDHVHTERKDFEEANW